MKNLFKFSTRQFSSASTSNKHLIDYAATCINQSDALLVTAGAGIGHDSGLATFRGKEGLWKAYPFFKKTNMSFADAANPAFFESDPRKFWFFYGHRFNMYQEANPHQGFHDLLRLGKDKMKGNYFVYTSNVDNHFQKAGFSDSKVVECHGSIFHFQCSSCWEIFEANVDKVDICTEKCEATTMPCSPDC